MVSGDGTETRNIIPSLEFKTWTTNSLKFLLFLGPKKFCAYTFQIPEKWIRKKFNRTILVGVDGHR